MEVQMRYPMIIYASFVFLHAQAISQDTLSMGIAMNRFLIVVSIVNDSVRTKFILDTGAGLEVVSNQFFDKVKDTAIPTGIMTGFTSIASRVDLKLYRIPSMQIGNYKKEDVIIAPYSDLDALQGGIAGLVSLKFFENQSFTMDFAAKNLILETSESLEAISLDAEIIPLKEKNEIGLGLSVFLPLVLNNRINLLAEFDTGTGLDIMISPYYFDALEIDTTSISYIRESFRNPNGTFQSMRISPISSIQLQHSRLIRGNNLKTYFLKDFIYEGLIGWQLFRDNKVTVDYPNRRILVR